LAVQQFASEGFAPLQARFHARDVLQGHTVHTSDGLEGPCLGVDARGALQLQTPAGTVGIISSEVSVRPAQWKETV
jgi:BirA family biotin operon repressor/biotin-[acetyl-CoA-carboxylase] ligase